MERKTNKTNSNRKGNARKAPDRRTASGAPANRRTADDSRSKRLSDSSRKRPSAAQRRRRQEAIRRQRLRYLAFGLFLGLAACLLIFSVWKLISIFTGYSAADKEYEDLRQYVLEEPVSPDEAGTETVETEDGETVEQITVPMERIDLASLQQINSDAVGWIEIPGTVISYPLVHTSDNIYYLTHTFRKEESRSGGIFIEHANSPDFTDLHTIIYGHNMKNGSMFAGLKNYREQSYYQAHPYIYIDLEDGSHCYEIFSCHEAPVTDVSYTIGYAADDIYGSFLSEIQAASLYDTGVDVGTGDSVITLSTCTSNDANRFVVHAKKLY